MNPIESKKRGAAQSSFFLRLDAVGGLWSRVEVPLSAEREAPAGVLDVFPGHVLQSRKYRMALLAPANSEIEFSTAALWVNGERVRLLRESASCSQLIKDNMVLEGYELAPADKDCLPFNLICGYARMRLELFNAFGDPVASFYSKDLACQQDDPINMENIEGIVDALTGDPEKNDALRWMIGDAVLASENAYSLIEGGYEQGASRSIPTYLSIIENGLDTTEAALPFMRGHAASRVQREEIVVDSSQVRRMGSREVRWLATHPETLSSGYGGAGSIVYEGRRLSPTRVSSSKAARSFDVYENRLILSFLEAIASSLLDFEAKVRRDQNAVNPFRSGGDETADSSKILMVAVARALQNRQRSYLEKAEHLRTRATRLINIFHRMLPGITRQNLSSMRLVRTKIFKEIRAYSQIYPHVERFCQYGEAIPGEDKLAIASLRLDRAYETYVLFRLLDWLRSKGFGPANLDKPIYAGKYGYVSDVYSDSPHVCNVYHLAKGDTRVDLFYEPVIPFGELQSHGMTLRRMNGGDESVYTPDFVLAISRAGTQIKETFILDAKYRKRDKVLRPYSEDGRSAYDKCVKQYLSNVVDIESWRIPDSMWLICGLDDDDPQLLGVNTVPWRAQREQECPSGLFLLTPQHDITPLFEEIGLVERFDSIYQPPKRVERPAKTAASTVSQTTARTTAEGETSTSGRHQEAPSTPFAMRTEAEEDSAQNPDHALQLSLTNAVSNETKEAIGLPVVVKDTQTNLTKQQDSATATRKSERLTDAEPVGNKAHTSEAIETDGASAASEPLVEPVIEPKGRSCTKSKSKVAPAAAEKPKKQKKQTDKKEPKAKGAVTANAADERKRPEKGLSDELLNLIDRICRATVEKETLFDANCAQGNFGFQHPLLRVSQPKGGEAKHYTKEAIPVADGFYYVYSSWRPLNIQRLKKTLTIAEKSLAKIESNAEAETEPNPKLDSTAPKQALPVTKRTPNSAADTVLAIYNAIPDSDKEALFDAQKCRQDIGINQPLLRRKQAKGYKLLPGCEDIFFMEPKLPSHVNSLERYKNRLIIH